MGTLKTAQSSLFGRGNPGCEALRRRHGQALAAPPLAPPSPLTW